MLHLLYVFAFTVLAVLAVSNMIRNVVQLGVQSQRPPQRYSQQSNQSQSVNQRVARPVPHPELLNEQGDVINEPLLVMRSISVKDARDKLNALYESSNETEDTTSDEA